jgi:hypothetical protein
MSMQATRLEAAEATSGTFEAEKPQSSGPRSTLDALAHAHSLACEIEEVLVHRASDTEPYGMRLARALAQSLIDQLADLSRDAKRTKLG